MYRVIAKLGIAAAMGIYAFTASHFFINRLINSVTADFLRALGLQ